MGSRTFSSDGPPILSRSHLGKVASTSTIQSKPMPTLPWKILVRFANARTRTAPLGSVFAVNGERSGAMCFLYFIRFAQVLAKGGRGDDARWVLDFGHTRRPEPFAKSANPYRGRGESAHRRLATERERFIGVAMDEDGYVIREDNEKYSQVRKTARPSPHENDTTKAPGQQRGIEAPSN